MMRVACVMFAFALTASAASAQGPAQQGPVNLSVSLQRSYGAIKSNLMLAAEKLPEADYGFKPSSMAEVRTYGQLFGHVANAQFNACSAARGVPNPNMGVNNEQKTVRAEIIKALADSFAEQAHEPISRVVIDLTGHSSSAGLVAGALRRLC